MASRKSGKNSRSSRSWKDIDQDVKTKGLSTTAWKRITLRRCKSSALFLLVATLLVAGGWAIMRTEDVTAALSKAGRGLPLKRIETQSTTLDREWILEFLDLDREGLDLLELDLADMKTRLERYPQVVSAELVRQIPDTLFISIEEREPVAKIVAEETGRGQVTLLVDGEGVVYEGTGYDAKFVRALPSMGGIRLKRDEGGRFEQIDDMDMVAKLLTEAQQIAPHLYRTWRVVSLAESPNIIVKSRFADEQVFEPTKEDFRQQFAKLDYIIDYYKSRSLSRVSRVDLTLQTQVPVTRAVRTR